MIRKIITALTILSLAGAVFLIGVLSVNHATHHQVSSIELEDTTKIKDVPVYSSGLQDKAFFDAAYAHARALQKTSARSVIAAHHLLVADKIAEIFESINTWGIKRVYILSPNHFDAGRQAIQISRASWKTPYGLVATDQNAAENVARALEISLEETDARQEHGIAALTPFIAHTLPRAQIVPIIIHERAQESDLEKLAKLIAEDEQGLLVASIDMSHNLPLGAQEFHDEVTARTIASGTRCPRARCFNLEIDANKVLHTLFAFNAARGTQAWQQTHHGSSLAMNATRDWKENTSHIIGYFEKGEPDTTPFASLHIVGDVMLDRAVRAHIEKRSAHEPWKHVKRFLMGAHLRVGNHEGTALEGPSVYTPEPPYEFTFDLEAVRELGRYLDVVSLANNHIRDRGLEGEIQTRANLETLGIDWFGAWSGGSPRYDATINGIELSLIGYHQFAPNADSLTQEIAQAKSEGRFVIVIPHWGPEYQTSPSQEQKQLAQLMVKAGSDLIVGGHPHVAQTIETIDGAPVVYSLGNFIFDQPFKETWPAMTIGVIIDEKTVTLYPLPVDTEAIAPKPAATYFAPLTFPRL